jgi:hypothetical protein
MLGALGTVDGTPTTGDEAKPKPLMFSAFTVTAYDVPFVSELTVHCTGLMSEASVEHLATASTYTVYPRIAVPPVPLGASHDTLNELLPGVTETFVGAPGYPVVEVVTEPALDTPTMFCASTLNVYEVDIAKPDTTHDVAVIVMHVVDVDASVRRYRTIAAPPFPADAFHSTTMLVPLGVARTLPGATGTSTTFTVVAPTLMATSPLPNWPYTLLPQQYRSPEASSAQA